MDTATQALLGATIAQAGFAAKLGRGRALAWGAVAGLVPDLDVIAVATHGPFGELLYHRGVTHALWFGPVVGPLLGWLVWRGYARRPARGDPAARVSGDPAPGAAGARAAWIWLFVWVLLTHPLLDLFTAYGTQLLAPLSRERFAWNGVGIIDPFYSGPLLAALVAGRWLGSAGARHAAFAALALGCAYLGYGTTLNAQAEATVQAALAAEGAPAARVRAYPTILQPWLRRFVARDGDRVRVGTWSRFRPDAPVWSSFTPVEHPLIERVRATREGSLFEWFAMGEISSRVIRGRDRVVVEIDDLRYGGPGPPDRGLWGIRAAFDGRGRPLGPIRRFDRSGDGS